MKKLYDYICRAEVGVAKYALVVIAILIFSAAIARCFRHPFIWAMDVAAFLFGWCVFLSGDAALRNDKLVCIDILVKVLPKGLQHYIKLFNYALILLFLAALIVIGTSNSITTRYRVFPGIPGFSYSWVAISVPVGSLLMLITTIRKIGDLFKTTTIERGAEQEIKSATELI